MLTYNSPEEKKKKLVSSINFFYEDQQCENICLLVVHCCSSSSESQIPTTERKWQAFQDAVTAGYPTAEASFVIHRICTRHCTGHHNWGLTNEMQESSYGFLVLDCLMKFPLMMCVAWVSVSKLMQSLRDIYFSNFTCSIALLQKQPYGYPWVQW